MDKFSHALGKRDALAQIFMMIRGNKGDFEKTFKELVKQYEVSDPTNPHCKWVKEFLNKDNG